MNAELEKQLAELVSAAKQTGTDVASFIAQQAPDVFQQIIAWHRFVACSGVLFGIALACLSAFLLYPAAKGQEVCAERGAGGVMSALFSFASMFISFPAFVKTYIAPKLIVLDYIARHL